MQLPRQKRIGLGIGAGKIEAGDCDVSGSLVRRWFAFGLQTRMGNDYVPPRVGGLGGGVTGFDLLGLGIGFGRLVRDLGLLGGFFRLYCGTASVGRKRSASGLAGSTAF